MSHTKDIGGDHKTRGLVAFHPIAFGLSVKVWLPIALPHLPIKYGSVGEEKELGNEILPDLDVRPSDA